MYRYLILNEVTQYYTVSDNLLSGLLPGLALCLFVGSWQGCLNAQSINQPTHTKCQQATKHH